MPAEPFSLADATRVLAHPDTPSAYVAWNEVLPLTGARDRTHLGNLLGWSHRTARTPLGASRGLFARALNLDDEDLVDAWMASLAGVPIDDFVDHHIPFLRNVASVGREETASWVMAFLEAGGLVLEGSAQRKPRREVPRGPDSVILEITRSCNFACSMCSSRTGGYLAERTMPLAVFGELVHMFGSGAKSVRLNGYGETTLVPGLDSYIACLDEFGFQGIREIITNLSAPTSVYQNLLARGFVVLASWDAASAETFERIRAGADYTVLEPRLRALGAAAADHPERLGLLFTVQEANLGEVVPVVELASAAGAGLVIFNMVKESEGSPWMDARFDEIADIFAASDETAQRLGVVVRIPDHVGSRRLRLSQTHRSSATYCDRPWREILVRWDTEATVCNMFHPWSYGLLVPPGPARDVPRRFDRIWRGPNASAIRRRINRDVAHPYCRNCYFLYA
ncbi:MAG: SPASM domain-containing protein [Planctomycetes bacterium]|nr:SPASM domain-containing protein [Planctomycetota bacterium]